MRVLCRRFYQERTSGTGGEDMVGAGGEEIFCLDTVPGGIPNTGLMGNHPYGLRDRMKSGFFPRAGGKRVRKLILVILFLTFCTMSFARGGGGGGGGGGVRVGFSTGGFRGNGGIFIRGFGFRTGFPNRGRYGYGYGYGWWPGYYGYDYGYPYYPDTVNYSY